MHDFICSENPVICMSCKDLTCRPNKIMIGEIFVSLSVQNVIGNNSKNCCLTYAPKDFPVLIDSILDSSDISFVDASYPRVIDVSTCLVQCTRCYSVLVELFI